MKFIKLGIFSILAILYGISCSSSGTVSEKKDALFPNWYQSSEFFADSSSYFAFGTAIASDSIKAIERAGQQARLHLEKNIGSITEKIREELEESGYEQVGNTDFIIILRTAHSVIGDEATSVQVFSKKMDGHFRGFSSVSISKERAGKVIEKGFTGHSTYWGEFSASEPFQSYF